VATLQCFPWPSKETALCSAVYCQRPPHFTHVPFLDALFKIYAGHTLLYYSCRGCQLPGLVVYGRCAGCCINYRCVISTLHALTTLRVNQLRATVLEDSGCGVALDAYYFACLMKLRMYYECLLYFLRYSSLRGPSIYPLVNFFLPKLALTFW
jgi:hypothetical protein